MQSPKIIQEEEGNNYLLYWAIYIPDYGQGTKTHWEFEKKEGEFQTKLEKIAKKHNLEFKKNAWMSLNGKRFGLDNY